MLPYRKIAKAFLKPGKKMSLSQAYGNVSMPEFSILSPDGTMIGPWMRCKDYIQDVIWGHINQKKYSIYGWSWDPESDPAPSNRWLILALMWNGKTTEQMAAMLENVKGTVEDIEKRLRIPKFRRTRFSKAVNNYFVIYASPNWLRSVGTVSFICWLIRASLTNESKKFDKLDRNKFPVSNDAYYIQNGANFIKLLLHGGFNSIEDDWKSYNIVNQVHNNGICGRSEYAKQQLAKIGIAPETPAWG